MKTLTYFHTTPTPLWESGINKYGLEPYSMREDNKVSLQEAWPELEKGIWLWMRMDHTLAHENYLWQRTRKDNVLDIMVLACDVDEGWLLHPRAVKRWAKLDRHVNTFKHTLHVGVHGVDYRVVHEEPFDICLEPIPASRITPLFRVKEELTQLNDRFQQTFVRMP